MIDRSNVETDMGLKLLTWMQLTGNDNALPCKYVEIIHLPKNTIIE